MEIRNKVILVTGASEGIGKSAAVALAKEGAKVIINFKSKENLAQKVLEECNKYSQMNMVFRADITNDNEVKKMFQEISKKYGSLDVLINNAGIFDESDNPENLAAFENVFAVNFLGQVRVAKHALELMKTGKIINVSSVHGRLGHGRGDTIAYSAMKAALDSYTKNLAKELAPKIIVNAIAPGKTLTPMWGELKDKEKKELGATHLINRFILSEEVADAISFLIKNDAVCGEVLTIDGGMSLKTLD